MVDHSFWQFSKKKRGAMELNMRAYVCEYENIIICTAAPRYA